MATAKITAAKAFHYGRRVFKKGDPVADIPARDLKILQTTRHVSGGRGTYQTRMLTASDETKPEFVPVKEPKAPKASIVVETPAAPAPAAPTSDALAADASTPPQA